MNSDIVYLRAHEPMDYQTSITWRNDDLIWSQLGGCKFFVSSAYEKKWIEDAIYDSKNIRLAVCLKADGLYIGNVGITNIDLSNRCGMVHILIGNRSYWNRGAGTESLQLLMDYAFRERCFHRLEALVLEDNISSIRIFQKCGWKEEGTLRETVFKNGRWHNQIHLAILETDYFQMQNS